MRCFISSQKNALYFSKAYRIFLDYFKRDAFSGIFLSEQSDVTESGRERPSAVAHAKRAHTGHMYNLKNVSRRGPLSTDHTYVRTYGNFGEIQVKFYFVEISQILNENLTKFCKFSVKILRKILQVFAEILDSERCEGVTIL